MANEIEIKQQRLGEFLDRHGLDGVLLTRRDNFAWITAGRDNHIANNSPQGVASLLATRDGRRLCLANAIEAPRMKLEELVGTGIDTVSFPWFDATAARKAVEPIFGDQKIAADGERFGLPLLELPAAFNELRWSLTEAEIERYRNGGRRAAAAVERACRALRPGISEHEAAALLDFEIHRAGLNPLVTLVAADDRILQFRHPIPTERSVRDHVMLVTCAEWRGLISCLTRFVRFSPMPKDLAQKHQAVCNIDAAVNFATRPGRTLGEAFDDLRRAYAENGFADQWQLHHQGGPTGYNNREGIGTPGNPTRVRENQAFAWNPSITGTKCEDTVLISADRPPEVLTPHSPDWPTTVGRADERVLPRADVLVL
jgi:Xaa-Pro aminopeptidase